MKYCLAFFMVAAAFTSAAVASRELSGYFSVAFLYLAASFLLLGLAYAGFGPGLLLKQACGRHSELGWVLHAPYFGLSHVVIGIYRLKSREPAITQVSPNLYFGRRVSPREAETASWVGVLDLAAEFSETLCCRSLAGYRSSPILDATAPTLSQLRSDVDWLKRTLTSGPVYVHCALGHGRSATVIAAYLLDERRVETIEDAQRFLQLLRPGVALNGDQLRRLREYEISLADTTEHQENRN